jgi:hypothetical protein
VSADRSDIPGTRGEASLAKWTLAASIRASGTLGTLDVLTERTSDDLLLQIHERDDDGAHLVEAAIRLDRKAVRALCLLLEREAGR